MLKRPKMWGTEKAVPIVPIIACPQCQKELAKEIGAYSTGQRPTLAVMPGVTMIEEEGKAPRIKCPDCGHVLILLRGAG